MSHWTHVIWRPCWDVRGETREPYTLVSAPEEACCFCGQATTEGIFVRANPESCHCKGIHPGQET